MKLTILGSGTLSPTPNRHPSAYLLEHHDTKILIDCGHTTIARLINLGINLQSIDAVGVSHFHTDHFADCVPLIHSRWVDDIQLKKSHQPITLFGPQHLEKNINSIRSVIWPEPKESYPITYHEGPREISIGDIRVDIFPIVHVPWFKSVGFKFTADGKTVGYPGDVGSKQSFNELVRQFMEINLLIIEVGAIGNSPNHLNFEQVLRLKKKTDIPQVILTHLREKIVEDLPRPLPQGIRLANDTMVINL